MVTLLDAHVCVDLHVHNTSSQLLGSQVVVVSMQHLMFISCARTCRPACAQLV